MEMSREKNSPSSFVTLAVACAVFLASVSAQVEPQAQVELSSQRDADYSALVVEPALVIIRNRLLLHRPPNVGEYISQHHSEIHSEIEAAANALPAHGGSVGGDVGGGGGGGGGGGVCGSSCAIIFGDKKLPKFCTCADNADFSATLNCSINPMNLDQLSVIGTVQPCNKSGATINFSVHDTMFDVSYAFPQFAANTHGSDPVPGKQCCIY